jgi:hypothetical protein
VVFKPVIARATGPKKIQPKPVAIPRYKPRFGHIGYVKGRSEYSDAELQQLHTAFQFPLAWPRKYVIS